MSYILDALKKSEQERGHGNIPDVQTIHSSSLNYRHEKKAYWPYILVAAVILNLLVIIYFMVNRQAPAIIKTTFVETAVQPQLSSEAGKPATKPDVAIAKAPVTPDNTITAIKDDVKNTATASTETRNTDASIPAVTIKKEVKTQANTKPVITNEQATDNSQDIIDFYDLPASIKQTLPAIIISAHVYSTNPAQRSIVINNNFMEEGEYFLDGLTLYEITPDGAIFNYQGILFNYGVVSSWQ